MISNHLTEVKIAPYNWEYEEAADHLKAFHRPQFAHSIGQELIQAQTAPRSTQRTPVLVTDRPQPSQQAIVWANRSAVCRMLVEW